MNIFNQVLIIGKVWPEPNSSAAGTRMMQLIDLFNGNNASIVFCSTAKETPFQEDISKLSVDCKFIQLNDDSFDTFIKELDPSLVVFDRFMTEEQFGWRVLEECPNALRVLNTEDLHFLRLTRQEAIKKNIEFDKPQLLNDTCYREVASIYRCDLTLLVSEFEKDLLESMFNVSPKLLYYLPLFADDIKATINSYADRKDFMFIGNFWHEPNWDAVRYLKESIWPLIRKNLPKAQLHVYGAYAGEKVQNLHNPKEGFIVHGRAEDACLVTEKVRVSLAPLRFGAGIKGKLLEAMVCGTPSVTTKIGAESMQIDEGWAGRIEDDSYAFAKAAVDLYNNESDWKAAQQKGFEILEIRYQKKDFASQFSVKMKELARNIATHRTDHFISQLIQHHSMLSTKYMSKWIAEKNKQ